MRCIIFICLVAELLASCAFSGTYLEPPASHGAPSAVNIDMDACLAEAGTPRELSSEERRLIEGKETSRLFMHGQPVVSPDGKPALQQSAFPSSNDPFADRYAVCLLRRGYSWRQK